MTLTVFNRVIPSVLFLVYDVYWQHQRGSHGAIRERVSFSVNTKGQKVKTTLAVT